MPEKVLIFTHNRAVASSLAKALDQHGFVVQTTGNKRQMVAWVASADADYVVVDTTDDPVKGLDLCEKLRHSDPYAWLIAALPRSCPPIPAAVDAHFEEPITFRKLYYRIKRLQQIPPRYLVRLGDVTFDPKHRLLQREGNSVRLTPKEAALLSLLVARAGEVVTRGEIMRAIWNTDYVKDTRTLEVHICWLRKKIEPAPWRPIYLQTVRGQGYRLVLSPESHAPPAR
jgi:DNA-binding response OmpR family regulator